MPGTPGTPGRFLPEKATIRAKLADGDRVPLLEIKGLEPLSGVLIPEVEVPVRSRRGEGAVLVEGDGVHRVNRSLVPLLLTRRRRQTRKTRDKDPRNFTLARCEGGGAAIQPCSHLSSLVLLTPSVRTRGHLNALWWGKVVYF